MILFISLLWEIHIFLMARMLKKYILLSFLCSQKMIKLLMGVYPIYMLIHCTLPSVLLTVQDKNKAQPQVWQKGKLALNEAFDINWKELHLPFTCKKHTLSVTKTLHLWVKGGWKIKSRLGKRINCLKKRSCSPPDVECIHFSLTLCMCQFTCKGKIYLKHTPGSERKLA